MAEIIDGKKLAEKMRVKIAQEILELGAPVRLAVVIVGNDPASRIYVNNKKNDCAECGIFSEEHNLPEDAEESDLLNLLNDLNGRKNVNGILVQLPLPAAISEEKVISAIDPLKDVDAFHPYNVGLVMSGKPRFQPCTPSGVMRMLEQYGIDIEGKHCVVVGRSNIVGKPMGMLLLQKNGTVTLCHSKTRDLKDITRQADILVSAVGKPNLITAEMVRPGAVVIDVAMNRNSEGKLCGDVKFDEVSRVAGYISPVPGGVGPMTRVMLLENTLLAARLQSGRI